MDTQVTSMVIAVSSTVAPLVLTAYLFYKSREDKRNDQKEAAMRSTVADAVDTGKLMVKTVDDKLEIHIKQQKEKVDSLVNDVETLKAHQMTERKVRSLLVPIEQEIAATQKDVLEGREETRAALKELRDEVRANQVQSDINIQKLIGSVSGIEGYLKRASEVHRDS